MNKQLITPLQQKALWVSDRHHYSFKPVSSLDYRDGWVGERVPQAPVIASERIKTLEAAGIRVCEVYVFHEAPKVLPAPKVEPVRQGDFKTSNPSIPNTASQEFVSVVGSVLSFFALGLFLPMLLLDPACVVKLDDGSFVEVVSWLHS